MNRPPTTPPTLPARRGRARGPLLLVAAASAWLVAAALRGGWSPWARAPADAGAAAARPAAPAPARLEPAAADVVVLDGDTLRLGGRQVRLAGADTPERAAPWFDGDQEPWAGQAAAFTRAALDRAGRVEVLLTGVDDDRGRALGHVLVDGRPLAALLVEAGLAFETVSRFGDGGRPDVARAVRAAARSRAAPSFEAPWRWRRVHRRESRERDMR